MTLFPVRALEAVYVFCLILERDFFLCPVCWSCVVRGLAVLESSTIVSREFTVLQFFSVEFWVGFFFVLPKKNWVPGALLERTGYSEICIFQKIIFTVAVEFPATA